ncbi:hypothetical protein D9758_010543 [Tetrapyrgos nigripes]|uniref:Golgi apparatus membrane protein TVP38 n=1 Tax=Tetrapyrgos nigripes TaxID=182062 RepID=A0A8H5FW32_9AGAR|nr:hypothetical protein D9758_010543 [Tetrapyrgos nigripes]
MYSSYHPNNSSQVDWQSTPNSYPPQSSSPFDSLPRKPSPYDTSNPVNVNFGPSSPNNANVNRAALMRTPSPTPSEQKELGTGAIDWKSLLNWRFWLRREWLWYYVALVIIVTITALVTLYHEQIVHWLTPVTRWLHDLKFGWLVPIGILFVISFPPLFGHEIVAILCGLVWGLWIGFAIVSAGSFLGEVGNFYAFKYLCKARGEKLEKSQISYACLAKVVRDGGFWVALIARYSAIPGHFTTAVFSTCGMGIIVFSLAAILSMPKQLITVYLGVILEQSSDDPNATQPEDPAEEKRSQWISRVVLSLTVLVTAVAMWYILRKMNQVKPQVIYERRKARQTKLARAQLYGNSDLNGSGSDVFTEANNSLTDIPLAAPMSSKNNRQSQYQPYPFSPKYQQASDSYSQGSNNIVYAPAPKHLQSDRYYAPANGYHRYGENHDHDHDSSEGGHGNGHVAPGAAALGGSRAYDYTPTRQNSDGDGDLSMGMQQEEYLREVGRTRQQTFTPPGIPVTEIPRTLTQSPGRIGGQAPGGPGQGQHTTSQSYSSLAYTRSPPPGQPLSPSQQSQYQSFTDPYSTSNTPYKNFSRPSPPETREIGHGPGQTPTSYPFAQQGFQPAGHMQEATDATFVTAIEPFGSSPSNGGVVREPSLAEIELHAPGSFPSSMSVASGPPPNYTSGRF